MSKRTVYCLQCGYDLVGITRGVCPECAFDTTNTPARSGTAWQLAPGIRTWWQTAWDLLAHPRRTIESVGPDRDPTFMNRCLGFGAIPVSALSMKPEPIFITVMLTIPYVVLVWSAVAMLTFPWSTKRRRTFDREYCNTEDCVLGHVHVPLAICPGAAGCFAIFYREPFGPIATAMVWTAGITAASVVLFGIGWAIILAAIGRHVLARRA